MDFDNVTENGLDEVGALSRDEQVAVQRCEITLDTTKKYIDLSSLQ